MESDKKPFGAGASLRRINTLLVDDEIGAINTLQGMLKEYCPQVLIAGVALTVSEAVQAANQLQPELVFLDIEMPPLGSGFDFLHQIADISFGVIFTTAYPKYAIRAINTIQPWAYLVKPYSVSELRKAVEIAVEKIRQQNQSLLQAAGTQGIVLHDSRKGAIVLRAGEIVYCKADGSFTDLFVWRNQRLEKVTSSRNLGEIEDELPAVLFCRTHHGFLVNLAFVERFERTGRNGIVHLAPAKTKVDVSVAKMDLFAKRLDDFFQLNQNEDSTYR